jgi:hypothetical protein
MAIKVLNSQVGLTRQSSSVETAKLNQDFGQDVFRGQMAVAEGIASVEEYQKQKKILDRENKKDEAVNGAMEDLIQLESEMYDAEGVYKDVPTADKEELFIKKRNEIISGYTKGYNTNLATEIKNDYNAKSLQIVRQFSNAQNGIIKNKAITNKLENINNKANSIDYNSPAEVIKDLSAINTDLEFLLDTGLINADGYFQIKNDTMASVLKESITQIAPNIGYQEFADIVNGQSATTQPILTGVVNLLNDDDLAREIYDEYTTDKIDQIKQRNDVIELEAIDWEINNKSVIQDLNSNDVKTRQGAFAIIQEARDTNVITESKYLEYASVINAKGAFAVVDDVNTIIELTNQLSAGTLTRKGLTGIDRKNISKQTYDNFLQSIETYKNSTLSDGRRLLYAEYGVETGMLDPNNEDHKAISVAIKQADGDFQQWDLGDFDGLQKEYPDQKIDEMSVNQFVLMVINKSKERSINVRKNAFIGKINYLNGLYQQEIQDAGLPLINFNNYNQWDQNAANKGLDIDLLSFIRGDLYLYGDFLDGFK